LGKRFLENKLYFWKGARKFIIAFLIVGVFPLLLFGVFSFGLLKDILEKEVSNKLVGMAESKKEHLIAYFDSLRVFALGLSSDKFLISQVKKSLDRGKSTFELGSYLLQKKSLDEGIAGIFITDYRGIIISATDPKEIGEDESDEEYIEAAKRGVYFSDLREDVHFGIVNPFVVSAPIKGEDDIVLGVLVVVYSTGKLEDMLSGKHSGEKSSISMGERFSKDVEVYLVNQKKEMVLHPHIHRERHHAGMIVDTYLIRECFENNNEVTSRYTNYAGEDVIGASRCLLDKKWVLVVEEKTSIAFQNMNKYYNLFFYVTFGIFGFVIFVGLIFSRRFGGPLKEFQRVVSEVKKGNYGVRAYVKSKDELGELATLLNEAIERLERIQREHREIEKSKTEFLSITSHELRSPMTPMKAQLQMLLKGYYGRLNEKQKQALEVILRNTERLDKIIVDLLELSRIEAARLKFNFVKVDLTEYIDKLIQEMKGFMPEKNIEIIKKIDKLPIIETDPDRVMQVLRNLINNAIKFSKPNGKVIVSATLKGDYLLFSVKDYGVGISPRDQKRIFEPFYQAEQTIYREHGGTGLGLAICRGIVESQGGKIWVESQPGKGSTFYFTLPLVPVKKIKPIRLMFFSESRILVDLREIFKEYLGPIGGLEFEALRKRGRLSKENIFKYINSLIKKGVLEKRIGELFKNKVAEVFTMHKKR
jgi:signal transduction histidine kinase